MTFTGIPSGTLARITAQPGAGCKLDHWMIDGVQNPTQDQTIYVTINNDRAVIAVCVNVPPVTLTVISEGSDSPLGCPITVSGLTGGSQTVPAGGTRTFTTNVNSQVTLLPQTGEMCYLTGWDLDGVPQYSEGPIAFPMDTNHTVTVYCYCSQGIY
jgi:hypothetical protein